MARQLGIAAERERDSVVTTVWKPAVVFFEVLDVDVERGYFHAV